MIASIPVKMTLSRVPEGTCLALDEVLFTKYYANSTAKPPSGGFSCLLDK